MKSNATTVTDYLASLPEEGGRRAAIEAVRNVILANLDKNYEECMLWGVPAYVVPHRVWPSGHHADPNKPVMMCGMSSQKNDMVVYLMNVFGGGGGRGGDRALREWFEQAWVKAGKNLGMCVERAGGGAGRGAGGGAGGCCIRFKKLDDIALEVIGEAVRRTPVKMYIENYINAPASGGGGGGGSGRVGGAGGAGGAGGVGKKSKGEKSGEKPVSKKAAKKVVKKSAKKMVTKIAKKQAKR